jgi:hypothetical protein
MLSRYEQQKNLTVTLLKKWLVEWKFRNWVLHATSPEKLGKPVTQTEKEQRAEEIAILLGDNRAWHSHGRYISAHTLRTVVRLEIEDYSNDIKLRNLIRTYNDLLTEFIRRNDFTFFLHSKYLF